MVSVTPLSMNEPAYIRLEGYPSSLVSTSVGDAPSDKSTSPHGADSVPRNVWSISIDPEGGRKAQVDCVKGNVWTLSIEPDGCRRVQDALEEAASDEEREALVKELTGLAVRAMRHPHANHVLQKIISLSPPASLQFMVDELVSRENWVTTVAKHRYGGRIVQQLLKTCTASQVSEMAETLMEDVLGLCCHAFGTFSMQHLLKFGTEDQRHRLAVTVADKVKTLGGCPTGSGVVATAMEHGSVEDKLLIARAVLNEPGLLAALAGIRHGNNAVLEMLKVLSDQELVRAYVALVVEITSLRTTRYGRTVAKHLEEKQLVPRVELEAQADAQPAAVDNTKPS